MSTLSQFFGSASTGGGTQTTSTMRVFTQTGSLTLPSDTVYVAYGALGGGGQWSTSSSNQVANKRSGGGAGFAFKEGAHVGAATICAIVAQGGKACECCVAQMKTQGGTSCVSGFTPGTICATGGCCWVPGCGVGGDINTCGGCGGWGQNCLGGSGAGGLYGNGGSAAASAGGGGFGSGGGGGAGGTSQQFEATCAEFACYVSGGVAEPMYRPARGGGGGQDGGEYDGGHGLVGQGGRYGWGVGCTGISYNTGTVATGGYIPQYTKCGYSQAKTYFAAAGGGGAKVFTEFSQSAVWNSHGAPGGGGGGSNSACAQGGGGNGGFGAGGGSGSCSSPGGAPGFGAGSGTSRPDDNSNVICGTNGGQGVVAVEYWVG